VRPSVISVADTSDNESSGSGNNPVDDDPPLDSDYDDDPVDSTTNNIPLPLGSSALNQSAPLTKRRPPPDVFDETSDASDSDVPDQEDNQHDQSISPPVGSVAQHSSLDQRSHVAIPSTTDFEFFESELSPEMENPSRGQPQPFPFESHDITLSDAGSSEGSSDADGKPRFTSQQKGKARAMPPPPISVDGDDTDTPDDESFVVIGQKRAEKRKIEEVEAEGDVDEDGLLAAYSVYTHGHSRAHLTFVFSLSNLLLCAG
jgi:hypothetical protein